MISLSIEYPSDCISKYLYEQIVNIIENKNKYMKLLITFINVHLKFSSDQQSAKG